MHKKCSICAERKLEINGFEEGKQVYVYEWRNRQEQRLIKGKIHNVQITTKEKVFGTLETILDELNKLLKTEFCKHVFNIVHQHCAIKRLKEDLTEKECLTHIDFSENYACKIETEVQGMPFGASRNQVSLHTGVMYYKEEKPESFCSISKNTRHDPAGIWAHLHPVICEIKEKYPLVNTLHFLSDGPTTQYRSKNNFYLMKQKCLTQYGFKTVTWNFSESGHGKGAPDGVGGLVKRTADKQVAYGKDIVSAHDLFTNLKELGLGVKLFLIDDELIIENDGELKKVTTKPVKGTMSLHQIVCYDDQSKIKVRDLSCFCTKAQTCDCYEPRMVTVSEPVTGVTEETAVPEREANDIVSSSNAQDNQIASATATTDGLDFSTDLLGCWVVVEYDNLPYPGIVQDISEAHVSVKVMHNIGKKRYFCPARDDIFEYSFDEVVLQFEDMERVTSRHMQIPKHVWEQVEHRFDMQ